MKILSLSDRVMEFIYAASARERFKDIDLVLGCGDLPYYYLEFLVDILDKPVLFVRGNHGQKVEYTHRGERRSPWGAIDLHARMLNIQGLLIAGFEGSVRYRPGPFQYSQGEMWVKVFALIPRLLWNRLVHGRALDILATHAPAWGLGDQEDPAHRGFKAFRWLLTTFKPRYHFHGHVHIYTDNTPRIMHFEQTEIRNTFEYMETELEIPALKGERQDG
ncbi:MAG: metallophosphoesterase [Chloroflexi bacterium]|nr:metallophosphoesterase [Chloroflexota bacterium]